jgi:hypothetical protein
MSDADEMKDADEKSDDDGERLATATRETRFSSRALRRTVVYRDDTRKTYRYDDVFK